MEKAGKKTRRISFYSKKNQAMVCVHSQAAKRYAMYLESQPQVRSYESEIPLEQELYVHVSHAGIRGAYFQSAWASNFLIHLDDGRKAIHEIISPRDLLKRSEIERLEFSRRYWAATDINEWQAVIFEEEQM